jgi:transposase
VKGAVRRIGLGRISAAEVVFAWVDQPRRLATRFEHRADTRLAFTKLSAALIRPNPRSSGPTRRSEA